MRRLLLFAALLTAFAPGAASSAAPACHPSGPTDPYTKTDTRIPVGGGVELAATLYTPEPEGCPHAVVPHPAIVMFHGLGDTRASMNKLAEAFFADERYVVLTFDARGHGDSGGLWGLDGPNENDDARAIFDWLAARPDVDPKHIGAYGTSLGGGAVWNSTVYGKVPWAAIAPETTWTDLYGALFPQNLSKSGLVLHLSQVVPAARTDPEILSHEQAAVQSVNLPSLHPLTDPRSVRSHFAAITTPTLLVQGRRDFLFDIDQALAAYRGLRGPKRLYLTDLGHAPSSFTTPDLQHAEEEIRAWFDHYLKGTSNGIETRPPIEIAKDPYTGTVELRRLPQTHRLSFRIRGRTIGATGKIVETMPLPGRQLETFGAPTVTLSLGRSTFSHVVAVASVVTAAGAETLVSDGGVPLTPATRSVTIKLLDQAVHIPAGARLRLTLAATSAAQSSGNALYLADVNPGSTLRVRRAKLVLPVMRRPISR
ncbi:MAG TPA: alpha/beta fold hydrolase [Gaiellaceae bacterium]|jgi:predicted acyl esterase|nr:alpha/beta fold hydrolase [Gaiellaceae bacterium]